MDRRRFLSWLTGTAAGVAIAPTLDVDRLLWVPGEKTIFLPRADAPLLWFDEMVEEYLRNLGRSLAYTRVLGRRYGEEFKVGDTLVIRLPQRWQELEEVLCG